MAKEYTINDVKQEMREREICPLCGADYDDGNEALDCCTESCAVCDKHFEDGELCEDCECCTECCECAK